MKTLHDLKTKKAKSGTRYSHKGNDVIFWGKTSYSDAFYQLLPTNLFETTKSKKEAIKFLETN